MNFEKNSMTKNQRLIKLPKICKSCKTETDHVKLSCCNSCTICINKMLKYSKLPIFAVTPQGNVLLILKCYLCNKCYCLEDYFIIYGINYLLDEIQRLNNI